MSKEKVVESQFPASNPRNSAGTELTVSGLSPVKALLPHALYIQETLARKERLAPRGSPGAPCLTL
jgi:hypothetical protein